MMIDDLLRFNNINLDRWTEMYSNTFYFDYLAKYPELCIIAESLDGGCLAGYLIAKVEGSGDQWHSHISALSIAPEFRKAGVATMLCDYFEKVSSTVHDCYFADLFVRVSNKLAIQVYKNRGYEVYRTIRKYYGGAGDEAEDGYDMRKPLARDIDQLCLKGKGFTVEVEDLE